MIESLLLFIALSLSWSTALYEAKLCIDDAEKLINTPLALRIDDDNSPEIVTILKTSFKSPYLAQWARTPDQDPETVDIWAVTNEFIVNANPGAPEDLIRNEVRASVQKHFSESFARRVEISRLLLPGCYLVGLPPGQDTIEFIRNGGFLRKIQELRADLLPAGKIEPNYILFSTQTRDPRDPLFLSTQHGLQHTRAPYAWSQGVTGSATTLLAVIDSGVACSHPDLENNLFKDEQGNVIGYDFYDRDSNPCAEDFHGTFSAGIVGAEENRIGLTGMNWDISIVPIRFMADGCGSTADAVDAVTFAACQKIDILLAAWGGFGHSECLEHAVNKAGLFVAAAGNRRVDLETYPFFPAAYKSPNILSVGATNHLAGDSSLHGFGIVSVDLSAPGVSVTSCKPGNGYVPNHGGTSAAAALTAGAAALLQSWKPASTMSEIRELLIRSARPVKGLETSSCSGAVLDLERALKAKVDEYQGSCRFK